MMRLTASWQIVRPDPHELASANARDMRRVHNEPCLDGQTIYGVTANPSGQGAERILPIYRRELACLISSLGRNHIDVSQSPLQQTSRICRLNRRFYAMTATPFEAGAHAHRHVTQRTLRR